MTIYEPVPPPLTRDDVKGTIWERLTALQGTEQVHPFALDSPGPDEATQLFAGEVRTIAYRGKGQVLLYNIDLPSGVTLALVLDGATKRFSHGNEAGVLRWDYGKSPLVFTNSFQLVVKNTTGTGQTYRVHVSGA